MWWLAFKSIHKNIFWGCSQNQHIKTNSSTRYENEKFANANLLLIPKLKSKNSDTKRYVMQMKKSLCCITSYLPPLPPPIVQNVSILHFFDHTGHIKQNWGITHHPPHKMVNKMFLKWPKISNKLHVHWTIIPNVVSCNIQKLSPGEGTMITMPTVKKISLLSVSQQINSQKMRCNSEKGSSSPTTI